MFSLPVWNNFYHILGTDKAHGTTCKEITRAISEGEILFQPVFCYIDWLLSGSEITESNKQKLAVTNGLQYI